MHFDILKLILKWHFQWYSFVLLLKELERCWTNIMGLYLGITWHRTSVNGIVISFIEMQKRKEKNKNSMQFVISFIIYSYFFSTIGMFWYPVREALVWKYEHMPPCIVYMYEFYLHAKCGRWVVGSFPQDFGVEFIVFWFRIVMCIE